MALVVCPECGKEISNMAKACPSCGYPVSSDSVEEKENVQIVQTSTAQPMKNPGVAAVLGVLVPGLGQIYNGQLAYGFLMMILVGGIYTIGLFGPSLLLILGFMI